MNLMDMGKKERKFRSIMNTFLNSKEGDVFKKHLIELYLHNTAIRHSDNKQIDPYATMYALGQKELIEQILSVDYSVDFNIKGE